MIDMGIYYFATQQYNLLLFLNSGTSQGRLEQPYAFLKTWWGMSIWYQRSSLAESGRKQKFLKIKASTLPREVYYCVSVCCYSFVGRERLSLLLQSIAQNKF